MFLTSLALYCFYCQISSLFSLIVLVVSEDNVSSFPHNCNFIVICTGYFLWWWLGVLSEETVQRL